MKRLDPAGVKSTFYDNGKRADL